MTKHMAVFGVGAAGSYIGAFLTREGYDVTLIDMWGEHVDQMTSSGLTVTGTQGDFTVPVKAIHLSDASQSTEPYDIIFLAVKSYDTEWASHFVKRLIKPNGVVVNCQNCMNDQLTASIVGYQRQVGCVMSSISVALWEPALGNPVGGMTGQGASSFAENPRARLIQIHIAKESAQVGLALNYDIANISGLPASTWANAENGEIFEELDAKFMPSTRTSENWRSSMAQDVTKGRRTEIEYMNGHIVAEGEKTGIPTPVNAAIVEVVRGIDQGTINPDPSNVEKVLQMAGL